MRDFGTLNHGNGYGYGLGVRTMIDKAKNGSNSSIGEYGWSGLMFNNTTQ
jgi:CubicO group peptidase (beta-lactamase class C family)